MAATRNNCKSFLQKWATTESSIVEQNQMKQKSQKWEVNTEWMQEEEYKDNTTLNSK